MSVLASKRSLAVAAAVAAVAAGAGAGVAASRGHSDPRSAYLDSVAKHLGVSPERLRTAMKAAAGDRIDEAVKDGRLSKAEANRLKERLEAGEFPPFCGPGFGRFDRGFHHDARDHFSAAAKYLGLSSEQLEQRLEQGDALADVARAEGKSVDGLEQALVADAKSDLDHAVANGRLNRSEADEILARLRARVDDFVDGRFPRWHDRFGGRPPAALQFWGP
jgi:ribosomal protein S20